MPFQLETAFRRLKRNPNKLVVKAKVSEPILVFRPVSLVKLATMTAFDPSFAKERNQGGLIPTITTCGVESEPTICTMGEFSGTVNSHGDSSTLAAESAASATALDRRLYLRLQLRSIVLGDPQ